MRKAGDAYGYDIRTGKMLWRFKTQSEEFVAFVLKNKLADSVRM